MKKEGPLQYFMYREHSAACSQITRESRTFRLNRILNAEAKKQVGRFCFIVQQLNKVPHNINSFKKFLIVDNVQAD